MNWNNILIILALCFGDVEEMKDIVSDLQTKKEDILQKLNYFPFFFYINIVYFSTGYKVEGFAVTVIM